MRVKIFTGITVVLLALSSAMGDVVTATSNAFSFPALTSVKNGGVFAKALTYFKHSGFSPKSGIVTLMWSVPPQTNVERGTIAIYTMRGQTVKTFPISAAAGAVTWRTSGKEGLGGVYVAKLTYGSQKQNLKLILCK
ncbi:MAG: T9SS type A sorting domain-containing protein [Chitinivibrionales bacterium]